MLGKMRQQNALSPVTAFVEVGLGISWVRASCSTISDWEQKSSYSNKILCSFCFWRNSASICLQVASNWTIQMTQWSPALYSMYLNESAISSIHFSSEVFWRMPSQHCKSTVSAFVNSWLALIHLQIYKEDGCTSKAQQDHAELNPVQHHPALRRCSSKTICVGALLDLYWVCDKVFLQKCQRQ